MATSKSQRIGILIIAVVMVVGTVGSFFVMILANDNAQKENSSQQAEQEKMLAEYEKMIKEQQKKLAEEAKVLSKTHYPIFKQYASSPAPFDGSKVKELSTRDLRQGDGAEIKEGTQYRAYYIGWNEKGKVFDQSIKDGALGSPVQSDAGLISGWTEGVIGMKIGGVRELTIPADKAYGDKAQGDDIPANAPLKFVVYTIAPSKEQTSGEQQ